MLTNWSLIAQDPSYIADYVFAQRLFTNSFGNSQIISLDSPFIQVLCHLTCLSRYYIKHINDQVDIDETLFITQLLQETGFDIPLSGNLPLVELLRESKRWNSHKGTVSLI